MTFQASAKALTLLLFYNLLACFLNPNPPLDLRLQDAQRQCPRHRDLLMEFPNIDLRPRLRLGLPPQPLEVSALILYAVAWL